MSRMWCELPARTFVALLVVGAAITILIPEPAYARARDDVMSGAYRCASIGDLRQWLDCYYGAAQPVRDQLGLPPAPAKQVLLAKAPPHDVEPAGVQIRDEVLAQAARCYAIDDDRQWLNCYYGAAQPSRLQLGLSPAPQAVTSDGFTNLRPAKDPFPPLGPAPALAQPSSFETHSAPNNDDTMVSRVASYSFDKYGIFTVTLANGQVWRQLSGDTTYAHWDRTGPKPLVRISHGFFGSVNFVMQGSPKVFKVERIR